MPRALWIHQNFVSGRQPGNCRASHQAAAWIARGWDLDILCTGRSYLEEDDGNPRTEMDVQREGGLSIHRMPPSATRSKAMAYLLFAIAALRESRRLPRPDLIFASSPPLPQLLPSLLLACWWRRPLVLEIRDLWPAFLEPLGMLTNPVILSAMRWLEALAYRCAGSCITVAPAYLPYLRGMGFADEELLVSPTGADERLGTIRPDEARAWRAGLGIAETDRVVLYAGSFNIPYPIPELLEAARLACSEQPGLRWVFAGNGVSKPAVAEAAERTDGILYIGSLPRDELAVVLAGADIGVVAHVDESLLDVTISGKLFDYMSAGLAVVSVQDGQMAMLVEEANAGTILPDTDPQALSQAVQRLANHGDEALKDMGGRGRNWSLEHFHADVHAAAMLDRVEAVYSSDERCSMLGLCKAMILATCDWLQQRSRRVLERHYGANLRDTVRDSTREWLDDPAHLAGPDGAPSHRVPRLLSARFSEPSDP